MKIKYDKPINLVEFVNESNYIAGIRKRIFENKRYPKYSSLKKELIICICYIMLLILGILFYLKTGEVIAKILCYILAIVILIMLYSFYCFVIIYLNVKKQDLRGTLTIDEKGIVDNCDLMEVHFKWDNIAYAIIGKYTFNIFINNNSAYFRIPIDIKDKLLKAIKKYSDVEIIDLANND